MKLKGTKTKTANAKLTNAESRKLLESLLKAQTEAEVFKIICDNALLSNVGNWLPLDGRETNWNVTNNQSASGAKAATELLTNTADAILLRLAVERGIDPRSPEAPHSSREALEDFLGWKGGSMHEALTTPRALTAWAQQNVVVAFSGVANDPGQPTLTFCDRGEGQHPEDFERTFLSLSAGNKKEIAFVQGKFNMGSSGVNGYCGKHKYKLVLSRKHTMNGDWGWTIVRVRPMSDLPVMEYFKPGGANGEIPHFSADAMMPLFAQNGQVYDDVSLDFGTVVKLYDFHIGSEFKDFNSTRRVFMEHLADTLIPIRILDMRVKPTTNKGKARNLGIDGRTFSGLEYHIQKGDGESVESADDDAEVVKKGCTLVDIGEYVDAELGRISIRGYYGETPAQLRGAVRSNHRVFHSVNGQIQHRESRGFLTECGFPALKDHIALVIDASQLTRKTHFEVWKADREMLKRNQVSEKYLAVIRDMVKNSEELKRLNDETYANTVKNATSKATNTVFSKLIKSDPTLQRLLSGNLPVNQVSAARGAGAGNGKPVEREPYVGEFSPTTLELVTKTAIELPQGGQAIVEFRTNAQDDYMSRSVQAGQIEVSDSLTSLGITVKRTSLRGGRMVLCLTAPDNAPLGPIEATISLVDPAMSNGKVSVDLLVTIVEAVDEKKPKDKKDRAKKDPRSPQISLPQPLFVGAEEGEFHGQKVVLWDDGFTEDDGGTSLNNGDGELTVKINIDNTYFREYYGKAKPMEKASIFDKYSLAMQVTMLGVERRITTLREGGDFNEDEADNLRRSAAAGFASVALTLVDLMPKVMSGSFQNMLVED